MPKPFALSLCAALGMMPTAASADSITLTDWQHIGVEDSGTWTVASNQRSVIKTQNRGPSYFVSSQSYGDSNLTGTFGVNTWADDDYIGLVLGWNQPEGLDSASFLLFSWKQEPQNGSAPGFTLAKVTGANTPPAANAQTSTQGYEVIAKNTGEDLGWQDNTHYGFEINYTQNHVSVLIKDLPDKNGRNFTRQFGLEGTEVLNVDGDFVSGQIGFFNQSQTQSYYGNLSQQDIVKPVFAAPVLTSLVAIPVPSPAAAGAGLLGCLGLIARRRRNH